MQIEAVKGSPTLAFISGNLYWHEVSKTLYQGVSHISGRGLVNVETGGFRTFGAGDPFDGNSEGFRDVTASFVLRGVE